jgi:gluconolactonase
MWQQSETYPDPAVEVLDPHFLKYQITNAAVERLATDMRFGEGPV